jgi:hypothetical protein
MTAEEYEEMKNGDFIRGAVVITCKVWRSDHVGLYLNGSFRLSLQMEIDRGRIKIGPV